MLKKLIQNLFGPKGEKRKQTAANEWVPEQSKTPEELCEVDPNSMTPEAIKRHLAVLYKRHNSAVSSLNPDLRNEARQMLEAIAECRDRYVGE